MRTAQLADWHVVLPIKRGAAAKTRLGLHDVARRALAVAFATDTMHAILACAQVRELVVVTEDETVREIASGLGAVVVAERHDAVVRGFDRLNAAIEQGVVARGLADRPVAALTADLPALRASELSAALALAAQHARSFVPDHSGVGTSMLTSLRGSALAPLFGLRSARAHVDSGAVELRLDAPGLRLDVDLPEDLHAAQLLGCGPATTALLTRACGDGLH